MLESDLKQTITRALKRFEIKIQPIESGGTGRGIPDWFYRSKHADGWIEFKCIPKLNDTVVIPFRSGQYSWLMNYVSLGGRAFLFIEFESQGLETLAIFRGMQIKREYTIEEFCRENTLCKCLAEVDRHVIYSILDRGNI